jgi:exonuclease SbcC
MAQQALTLQLKNYRRFVATNVIAFEPGLTIINGLNGTGKSTLIEAFIYALFGPGSKRGQGIFDIRTDSANEQVRVACKLFIDDQEVHIIRSGAAAELRINEVVQVQGGAGSGKSVTARIIALLGGLTREQFERTYVALQGDTAGLVTEKANERRQIIEKILQLEVLTRAVELQVKSCERDKGGIISLGNLVCDDLSLDTKARELVRSFQAARVIHTKLQYTQQLLNIIEKVITERQRGYQETEEEVSKALAWISTLNEQLQGHQVIIERASSDYEKLEECQNKHNAYQEKIANIDGKVEQSWQDVKKYQDLIQHTEQYTDASVTYHKLQEDMKNCEIRLERIPFIKNCYDRFVQAQSQLETLDRQLGELALIDEELYQAKEHAEQAKRYVEMLSSNDPTQADYEEWHKQSSMLEHETQQNKEALDLLTSSPEDARCPTCNQRFVEHTPEYRIQHLRTWLNVAQHNRQEELLQRKQSIDERKKQWEQEKGKAESGYDQLQKHVVDIEKKVSTRDTLLIQHKEIHGNFLASQQAWLALEEDIPDAQIEVMLQEKLNNLNKQASMLKTQADAYAQLSYFKRSLVEKQQQQEELHREKQDLLEQQRALNYNPENLQLAKDLLVKVSETDIEIRSQLHEAELALKDAQLIAQQAQKDVESARSYHSRFRAYIQEYYREERLREHLEEFKKHFFEANTEEVMRRTTELLMHAITDQSILGVKFDRDEFQYLDASYFPRPVSRLSGGEKALVGLCLRIALAEQAQTITRTGRVKFLVLDEVLSSLDDERSEAVKRIFDDVLQRGIFDHIIMITHLDTVKQSWHAHWLSVQKLDGKISRVMSGPPGEVPMDLTEEIEV